jgi:RND family efflux transporter MFP subunit
MKLIYSLGLLLVVFETAGCKAPPPATKGAQGPVRVTVAAAREVEAAVEMSLTGTFMAEASAVLAAETEGVVAAVPVKLGDFVEQGAPVLVIQRETAALRMKEALARHEEAQAVLAQAEARLGKQGGAVEQTPEVLAARAALESAEAEEKLMAIEAARAKRLLETGDVSRASHDRARASLEMARGRTTSARKQVEVSENQARQATGSVAAARAQVAQARAQVGMAEKALHDTVVRAPFAGFVSAKHAATGEYVNNQSKLIALERIQPLKLVIHAAEAEMGRLRAGMKLRAAVKAFGAEEFEGRIEAIAAGVNPGSRSFQVEGRFENRDLRLKPGMFATVRVEMGEREKRCLIPTGALDFDTRTETNRVWVVEGGQARMRLVEVAHRAGKEVQIRRGVAPGEVIVLSERSKLYDGVTVGVN